MSAIPEEKKESRPALPPMVIRGGLTGDAFPKPLPPKQAEREGQSAAAPLDTEGQKRPTPAGPGNGYAPQPATIDAPR